MVYSSWPAVSTRNNSYWFPLTLTVLLNAAPQKYQLFDVHMYSAVSRFNDISTRKIKVALRPTFKIVLMNFYQIISKKNCTYQKISFFNFSSQFRSCYKLLDRLPTLS